MNKTNKTNLIDIAKEFKYSALMVMLLVVILITFFIAFIVLSTIFVSRLDWEWITTWSSTLIRLGPVGDYIGGLLNPLVALSALVGLIISVGIQRNTLKLTNDSLNESRKSIREQLDQDNFFALLSNREAAIENITLSKTCIDSSQDEKMFGQNEPVQHFQGRAAIREIIDYIGKKTSSISNVEKAKKSLFTGHFNQKIDENKINEEELEQITSEFKLPRLKGDLKNRVCIFAILYSGLTTDQSEKLPPGCRLKVEILIYELKKSYQIDSIEELLGHIFRSTYQVLKFVYRSDFSDNKKHDLVNYLRAQMSEVEFAAFALSGLTNIGVKSRAVSIAFNLYEKRLLSTPWAKPLSHYFDPKVPENFQFAKNENFDCLVKN